MPPNQAKPMPRSSAALRGYPNPYSALDANGMPAGFCRYDPEHGNVGEVHHVGATLSCAPITEVRDPMKGETRPTKFATKIEHVFEPATLPHTDYFVKRFRDLDLIVADEATARICGMAFSPPADALRAAKQAVIAEWQSTYGAPPPVDEWPTVCLVSLPDSVAPDRRPAVRTASLASDALPLGPEFDAVLASLEWMGEGLDALARVARSVYGAPAAAADGLQTLSTLYLPGTAKQLALIGVVVLDEGEPRPVAAVVVDLVKAIALDPSKELHLLIPPRLRPLITRLVAAYVEGNEAAKAIPVNGNTALAALLGVTPPTSKQSGAAPGGDQ